MNDLIDSLTFLSCSCCGALYWWCSVLRTAYNRQKIKTYPSRLSMKLTTAHIAKKSDMLMAGIV